MTPDARAALHAACFICPRPWTAAEFANLLAAPGVITADDPAGFGMARVAADESELLTLAVAPAHRRTGRGRALLARIETASRGCGARRLFLEVAADNDAAVALYLSTGYRETGHRPAYFRCENGRAIDALVLSKPLSTG